jgi:hypothetical protein
MDGGCLNRMREVCQYKKTCQSYSKTSHTCNHMGGSYCGIWRTKKNKVEKE